MYGPSQKIFKVSYSIAHLPNLLVSLGKPSETRKPRRKQVPHPPSFFSKTAGCISHFLATRVQVDRDGSLSVCPQKNVSIRRTIDPRWCGRIPGPFRPPLCPDFDTERLAYQQATLTRRRRLAMPYHLFLAFLLRLSVSTQLSGRIATRSTRKKKLAHPPPPRSPVPRGEQQSSVFLRSDDVRSPFNGPISDRHCGRLPRGSGRPLSSREMIFLNYLCGLRRPANGRISFSGPDRTISGRGIDHAVAEEIPV